MHPCKASPNYQILFEIIMYSNYRLNRKIGKLCIVADSAQVDTTLAKREEWVLNTEYTC